MMKVISVRKLLLSFGLVFSVIAGSANAARPAGQELCINSGGTIVYYSKLVYIDNGPEYQWIRVWRCEGGENR